MPKKYWPFMITSLLLSACSHVPGEYRERGERVFDVVQRDGESYLEFFLCKPDQDDCQTSPKTPYFEEPVTALAEPETTNAIPVENSYSTYTHDQLKAFEQGLPVAIYFEFESAWLNSNANELLPALVKHLLESGTKTIAIRGETDGFGSRLFNETLAMKRIQAVKRIFADNGFPEEKFVISKNVRCCRQDRASTDSIAAARGDRVVLLLTQHLNPE